MYLRIFKPTQAKIRTCSTSVKVWIRYFYLRNFKTNNMKKILVLFFLIQNISYAQLYLGGELNFASSISNQSGLDVKPSYLYQISPGISGIYISKKNDIYKGSIAFVKDRFNDNSANSYLNDYTQLSFQRSFLNSQLKNNWHQSLSLGFYVSHLNRYGVALANEQKYTLTENLGNNIKCGIVAEYAIRFQNNNWLSSMTLNTKGDISKFTALSNNNLLIRDNVIQVGLVLNVSKNLSFKLKESLK